MPLYALMMIVFIMDGCQKIAHLYKKKLTKDLSIMLIVIRKHGGLLMKESKVKYKIKWLFYFKVALINFTKNEQWMNNFLNDIKDNQDRYIKVKVIKG